jgi:hypothetical protein
MKTINLNLDYKRKETEEGGNIVSNSELSVNYISFGFNKLHPNGVGDQLRRNWGRLQRKLDKATEDKIDLVELEDSEFDLVEAAIKADFPSTISKFVNVLEEEINRAKQESDKK